MTIFALGVQNPFVVPALALSGRLQHHHAPCEECEGHGCYERDIDEPECKDCESYQADCMHATSCSQCGGEGKVFWGSWYAEDKSTCEYCGTEDVYVAQMYEGCSDHDYDYVCLPCYVEHHQKNCGCALWEDVEKMFLLYKEKSCALEEPSKSSTTT